MCASSFCDVFELGKIDLFHELQRRDIDPREMLKQFARIHEKNSRRNKAVQENLDASKRNGTKLSKMIDSSDDAVSNKRAVLDIFLPGSLFRFGLDICCMALILYFSVFVLYRFAFRDEDDVGRILPFDIAADVFFVVDAYLRAALLAVHGNGSVCTDKKTIFQSYMKSGMVIDVLSCISIFELVAPGNILRLFSLLRITRIPSFINKIRDHLALRGIRISLATALLGKIILFYAIVNHAVACTWFIIHRYIERDHEVTWATADCPWGAEAGSEGCLARWDDAAGRHNICDMEMKDCYLRSLHFALTTLSTVGYGDIYPVSETETIWENIVVLVGACFLAGLIGAFGAYLGESDTIGSNAFKDKIQKLTKYLDYRNIPEEIQASILFFHHCRWKDSQTLDERETLSLLPEPLQLDISFAVKRRVIRQVPILDSLPNIVQKRIAHALILQVFSTRDHPLVYSQGDIGWEIFFIGSGVVSVSLPTDMTDLDETGRANAGANKQKFDSIGLVLGAGNHVGETCISSKSGVRQETIVALTAKVELYALTKDDLNEVCRLMGPEKGVALKRALLTRNKSAWHNFDEIEGLTADWDDVTSSNERRQDSLGGRNNSFFPWSTPKNNPTELVTSRRRRLSQQLVREPLPSRTWEELMED